MNALIFVPWQDTPGVNPESGFPYRDAKEFQREAHNFALVHDIPAERVVLFDNAKLRAVRRFVVLDHLQRHQGLDCVAFFCHGWRDGIQAGFGTKDVPQLARALHEACVPGASLPLYCCSTARGGAGGDGGFADTLRDALSGLLPGAKIDAHTTPGHTTRNPHVRRFVVGAKAETGGEWLVDPAEGARFQKWRRVLQGDARFQFPFMTTEAIRAAL